MSQLTQAQFEALYNSSGSGTFATNSSNNIGSASLRAFAKDISDTIFSIVADNPDVVFRQSSDFITYNNDFSSVPSGAGATINQSSTYGVDNTSHALGVYSLSTGTTAAGYYYLVSPGSAPIKFSYGHSVTLKFRMAVEALSDGANTYTTYWGFGDNTVGAAPSNGAYFKYTHGTNSGKFQCITVNATTATTTNTTVSMDTSYHRFEIRVASDATSVVFLIDGTVVATHTTNIPTSNGTNILWGIVKSLGATARLIDIDWYNLSIIRTSAR